jgi:hypothetical protein
MTYTFNEIYRVVRPEGTFYAENHGANTAGVYFIGPRCRKGKYIATAHFTAEADGVTTWLDLTHVKARIENFIKNPF